PWPFVDQSKSSGLPAVFWKPEMSSRVCRYVYVADQVNLVGPWGIGESETWICDVCDLRSDRVSYTCVYAVAMLASPGAMEPGVGTLFAACAKTRRPSSSENGCDGLKLRSNDRCWSRLTEYVPVMPAAKRPSSRLPFHDAFARTDRGVR